MTKLLGARPAYLLYGALFGFLLNRAGATTYDFYAGLFLFSDLQLLWVIAAAAGVGAAGIGLLKAGGAKVLATGEPIAWNPKPYKSDLIGGSLLLGAGWGLAGACPGTVLAMIGEGKMGGLFTLGGIAFGTWLYGVLDERRQGRPMAPATA